jgi:DNA-binding IclR family transcriptional regulator
METTITFPVDPDLSDVRTMVLSAVQSGRGDSFTAEGLAARFGLPTSSVQAALRSLVATGQVIAEHDGFASSLLLD